MGGIGELDAWDVAPPPATDAPLDLAAVGRFARSCFRPGGTERVGAEIEFLTVSDRDPMSSVAIAQLEEITAPIPLRGSISFEPGGQIEIVSPPDTLANSHASIAADLHDLRAAFEANGIRLCGIGMDPIRPEQRVLRGPRYDAMETFFDVDGPSGRLMMSRTASIQVNLDFGASPEDRWRLAHVLGPTMAAAFSNSPLFCGAPSGWRSTRLSTWRAIDPTRTAPVGGDGPRAWARYALDARVMLVRRDPAFYMPILSSTPFRAWMTEARWPGPGIDDLAYHCTTIFPPIRPRGWLEIRMCDALPDPWWTVPIAVWTALLYDEEAGERARRAAAPVGTAWLQAARAGMSDPIIAAAAREAFSAAIEALPRVDADAQQVDLVGEYFERWIDRGRSPADDWIRAANEDDQLSGMEVAWT